MSKEILANDTAQNIELPSNAAALLPSVESSSLNPANVIFPIVIIPTTDDSSQENVPIVESVSEIALDAWTALGLGDEFDQINSSVEYINTNVGQRINGDTNATSARPKPPQTQESNLDVGFECTESLGSICSVGGAPEGSVTSFSSVYEEIQNCEDDIEKIRKLLELDEKKLDERALEELKSSAGNKSSDSNSDSSSVSPTPSASTSKKRHNRILGSINSKCSNTSNKKASKHKQKRSVSPHRRKIIVCDGKVGLVGLDDLSSKRDKSPYKCEFFDAKHRPPKGKQYHEVYVSAKEYRLIQSFIPPKQQNNTQLMTEEAAECQRTLFGWVAFGSTPTPPSTPFTPGQIPLQFCRSGSRLGKFSTVSDPEISNNVTIPILAEVHNYNNKGTQTMRKAVDFDNNLEVRYDAEAQAQTIQFSSADDYVVHEVVENIVDSVQTIDDELAISEEVYKVRESAISEEVYKVGESAIYEEVLKVVPSVVQSQRIDRTSLGTVGRTMCSDVFAASEASVILINTVFKDIVHESNVPESLNLCPKFKNFITSSNEMEALEKAAAIYASAADRIYEYLQSVKDSQTPLKSQSTVNPNLKHRLSGPKIISTSEIEEIETREAARKRVEIDLDCSPKGSTLEEEVFELGRQVSNVSNVWSFAPELRPEKFELSLTSRPGILLETIDCNNWQYSISYTGGVDRINLLSTATREKSEPVVLNPQCLFEMVDRNSSFACGRLTTSKFYLLKVCDKFGNLVQDYLIGKYSKPTPKYTAKLIAKFRSQNVFSGVIFQISVAFLSVCKKILNSIEKAMKIDDILRCPRLPGFKFDDGPSSAKFFDAPRAVVPMKEAIQDLSVCMNEIDSILSCGQNSLVSIGAGVKVKKRFRNTIQVMCDAVKQLEFGHDIDFGTVMMALTCNVAVIQSLSDVLPTVDVDLRSRILCSLGHLHFGAGEVARLTKRISLLSSFVAGKTFGKLSKHNQIQSAKKKLKKQKKDLSKDKADKTKKNIGTTKTIERIVQHRKEEESRRMQEVNEQLARQGHN